MGHTQNSIVGRMALMKGIAHQFKLIPEKTRKKVHETSSHERLGRSSRKAKRKMAAQSRKRNR